MALRALVLHLGAHKTGTSLVQKYLRDKERQCQAAGIWPMPRGEGDEFIGWGRAAEVAAGAEGLRARLAEAEARKVRCFVLSHENALGRPFRQEAPHLYPDAARHGANLRQALGADRPWRVVYYIRNQASFLESYYLQTVHEGAWHDFDSYMTGLGAHGFSWVPLYEALCDLFGAENVVLRSFDEDIAAGQAAYLERFLRAATAADLKPFGAFDYKPVRNPSVGDRGLDLARAINPLLRNPSERKLFRKFLQEHFSNRDYPRPALLSEAAKAEMRARYDAENAELLALSARTARAPS